MTVGHDTGRSIVVREIVERPDAADLDVDIQGKWEEVEAPVIAVQHLRR